MQTVLESLEASRVRYTFYDRVRVEPTDESFLDAIAFARAGDYDAYVAVGGGSTIDTAKAVNLYTTYPPADFLDYVNPPIGKGLPVPGPLKPLIAIPTTAGTGSETTGVTIFDLTRSCTPRRASPAAGSSRRSACSIRTTRARMPPEVAASSGLDILSHAIESFTALPFTGRPRPGAPGAAAGLSGLESDQRHLVAAGAADGRAVPRPRGRAIRRTTRRARSMLLAASYAGVGFGNAGVHLPHGMSYPVSGNVRTYRAPGYDVRPPAGAARHLGDSQCAGGLSLHRAGQSRSAICRRPRRSAST